MNVKVRTIDFLEGLTILFIYLKLTAQIDWTWMYVLMPILLKVAFFLVGCILSELAPDDPETSEDAESQDGNGANA